MGKKNDELLEAVKFARAYEKLAVAEAQNRAKLRVIEETKDAHDAVIEAVRAALMAGQTARQIGFAYGSSDPNTARKLVQEAMLNEDGETVNEHPNWTLKKNSDGTFSITAHSLGETGLNGFGVFQVDEDGENFSLIEGDLFLQIQLYKLGYKDAVLKEAK